MLEFAKRMGAEPAMEAPDDTALAAGLPAEAAAPGTVVCPHCQSAFTLEPVAAPGEDAPMESAGEMMPEEEGDGARLWHGGR